MVNDLRIISTNQGAHPLALLCANNYCEIDVPGGGGGGGGGRFAASPAESEVSLV